MTSCQAYDFSLENLPESPVETPLSHLTTTNDPPTDDEIGIVHEVIHADKVTIDQIDKILDDLSNLEKMIKSRRTEYTQRIEQHKQILKLHRSLPSDALCEIFQHILFDMRATFGSRTSPHNVLGKVCRRWRNVLFSNPRLWTMLPEFDLGGFQTRRKGFNSMLRTALRLSRAAALNVEIRHVDPSNSAPHPALAKLLPSSDRYRRLSLSIFYHYLPQFASIRGRLSILRSLDLHIYPDGSEVPMHPLNLFDNAPNLQDLTLDFGLFPKPLPEWLSIPWPQLVRFSGHWIKPIDIVTLLSHATSLEDCTFHCAFPPTALGFLPSIIHHRLVKLRIYPQEGVDTEPLPLEVLNRLTLPSLLEITIKDIGLQTATLVNLVTRSRCVLTFVDLETFIYGDISSFLNAISAVRILCIVPTETLMRFLFQDQTHQPILPRLRYLMFYSMTAIPAPAIAWIPLARAMQPTVDHLETFIIVKVKLRRSHYEAYYDQLDQWPGLEAWEAQFPVYERWITLIENSLFENNYQDPMQQMVKKINF